MTYRQTDRQTNKQTDKQTDYCNTLKHARRGLTTVSTCTYVQYIAIIHVHIQSGTNKVGKLNVHVNNVWTQRGVAIDVTCVNELCGCNGNTHCAAVFESFREHSCTHKCGKHERLVTCICTCACMRVRTQHTPPSSVLTPIHGP